MRSGKWKYIREGKTEFLHDLTVDEREQADFGVAESTRLTAMRNEFDEWASHMQKYPARQNG
jgi:hypothetical protein